MIPSSQNLVFWFIVGLLSGSCQRQERAILVTDGCVSSTPLVKEVSQQVGVVYYDSTNARYGIQVATGLDSADLGLACNLPTAYQQSMKKVRFSGRYYQLIAPKTGPVGYRFYELTVTNISSF